MGSWTLDADIERDGLGDGVIFSRGSNMSGISFYVKDNRLTVDYNAFTKLTRIAADVELPDGRCTIGMSMDGEAPSAPGEVTIYAERRANRQRRHPLPGARRVRRTRRRRRRR